MYLDERKSSKGVITYRITYTDDDGKRKRLSPKDHPKFLKRAEADQWVKGQEAYQQARRAKMAKKLQWKIKFYDFVKLEKDFLVWHAKNAPNSWQSSRLYLTYVFDFFLNKKEQGNVNLWNLWHQEFKDFLEDDVKSSTKKEKLSYSTLNHCIRTLNNFQEFLVAYNLMDHEARLTCEAFPSI